MKHVRRYVQYSLGFSLIELLVVIAILGVLSAFLFGQFGGARERTRDAQRKVDLRKIQTALEAFYQDNGEYPDVGALCGQPASTALDILFTEGYIAEIPLDPNDDGTGGDYYARYSYDDGCGCGFDSGTQTYRLYAWVENDDDAQVTDACGAHTTRYCEPVGACTRFIFMVRSP